MKDLLHFIIKEDGKIYLLRDVPDRNRIYNDSMTMPGSYPYALQKAKDNAVLVSNTEVLPFKWVTTDTTTWFYQGSRMTENVIYTLTGYKVEIKPPTMLEKDGYDEYIELAVISPIEPEESNNIETKIQEVTYNGDFYNITRTEEGIIKAYKNGGYIKPDPFVGLIMFLNNALPNSESKSEPYPVTDWAVKNEVSEVSDLLAILHGDGGHYRAKHGTSKAIKYAIELIHDKWVHVDRVRDLESQLLKAKEDTIKFAEWLITDTRRISPTDLKKSFESFLSDTK